MNGGGDSSPSSGRGRSKCASAVAALRSEIRAGKFSPAHPFPSIVGVCRRFGTSRATAVKVLDRLKAEGLVRSRLGAGTFVVGRGSSRLVGLVIPGIAYSSEFFQPIVSELVRCANGRDYAVVMDGVWSPESSGNAREAVEVAARLIKRRVAGVVYQPLEYAADSEAVNRRVLAAFARAGIPVVLLDGDIVAGPCRSGYDLVSIDNVAAGETLAAHVIARGAKNVVFLMRANWVENVKDRARGVRNAVLAAGLRWTPKSVARTDAGDAEAVRRLMRRSPRPDAVVCENDVIAAGLVKTLQGLGVRVPGDVQVTGFDDVQVASLSTPGITTIRQPCAEIAQLAFGRLLARIANPGLSPLHLVPSAALVVRGSTAERCPRAAEARKTK